MIKSHLIKLMKLFEHKSRVKICKKFIINSKKINPRRINELLLKISKMEKQMEKKMEKQIEEDLEESKDMKDLKKLYASLSSKDKDKDNSKGPKDKYLFKTDPLLTYTEKTTKRLNVITTKRMTTRECVKIDNLRLKYGPDINLKEWFKDPNNIYCGRAGRVFIGSECFGYRESIWKNPYKITEELMRDTCLTLYERYIKGKIENEPEVYNLELLRNKNLGCFCKLHEKCHVDILLSLLNE